MTYDQFQTKYNNKPVEAVDPTNANQCFDLVVQYCMDVLGLPVSIFSGLLNAKQIWIPSTSLAVKNFNYIDNTPDAIPQKGDIIVWNGTYNGYYNRWGNWIDGAGHTGIASGKGDVNYFECFEQNDPTGTYSHLRTYDYQDIYGWLRFKTVAPAPIPLNDTQKVNAITKECQTHNSEGDKLKHIGQILGLV